MSRETNKTNPHKQTYYIQVDNIFNKNSNNIYELEAMSEAVNKILPRLKSSSLSGLL